MLNQIPGVAIGIGKHGYRAVNLTARFLHEFDAAGTHCRVVAGKVIGFQEEADPPSGLVADRGQLPVIRGLSEKQSRTLIALRLYHKPVLTIGKGRILHAVKAKVTTVERPRPIEVINHQGHEKK